MATDQRNLPAFFNTNADFQSWCQGIHAQMVVAGMTQTSDTGQINNTTVTKPSGTNTSQGYEIWRDSSSSFFFKLEYGSGNVAASAPGLWITPGTGSNGSGTMTGPGSNTFSRSQLGSNFSEASGSTLPSYCSGDGSYITFLTNVDTGGAGVPNSWQAPLGFVIDRVRDASGTPTGEGFIVLAWAASSIAGNTNTAVWVCLGTSVVENGGSFTNSGFPGVTNNTASQLSIGFGLRSYGGSEFVMPAMIGVGQLRFFKAFAFYNAGDFGFTHGITFPVNTLGGTHTYITMSAINQFANGVNRYGTQNSNDEWAFLWE